MSSIGESAVRGLETGFLMGSRVVSARQAERDRQQRERESEQQRADLQEERAYQRTRQQAQDKRAAAQDERQRRLDELKLLDSEMADLQTEGQGLFSQFGGYDKVPEDVRTDYTGRVRALRGRRGQLRQSFYGATVEEQRRAAAETWARIQSGQMSADELSGDDLVRTLTAQTGRPVSDFLGGRDGSPSVVRQAILDVEAGLQAGNRDLLLRGANVLLQRELSTGIGTEGRDGSEIVGKKLVDLVPHPQDPSRVVPILEVTVRRDDGAIGAYRAPVTEDRGVYATDPNAMPKALTVQQLVERLGHVGVMEAWVNDPETRQRIESASPQAKASADEFLKALGAIGVTRPKPGKVTRERVDLGDVIEEREVDEASGKVLSVRHLGKGLAPRAGARAGAAPSLPEQPARGVTGAAVLEGLSEDDATIVEGLANGTIRPSEISTRGNRRERMLALAKRFDPTADFGPDGRLKDVPAAVRVAATENQTNLRRAERALRLVGGAPPREGEQPDPEATGWKGWVPNQLLNRWDPEGVEARAAIADLGSLVIHSRSGAAVTAAEFPRLAPFIPSEKDDAATVKKKLRGFVQVYREELDALQRAYSREAGFKGLGVAADGQEPAGRGATTRLPSDPKAAAEAYRRLPSGAEFIDPNGVTRRKP